MAPDHRPEVRQQALWVLKSKSNVVEERAQAKALSCCPSRHCLSQGRGPRSLREPTIGYRLGSLGADSGNGGITGEVHAACELRINTHKWKAEEAGLNRRGWATRCDLDRETQAFPQVAHRLGQPFRVARLHVHLSSRHQMQAPQEEATA